MRTIMMTAGVAALLALGAQAETRQAATAQELYEALVALNGTSGKPVIELTGSAYDVSSIKMKNAGDNGDCHLYAKDVVIRGVSANPRDTVIYGDKTTRVLYLDKSALHNVTVSNGYFAADYGPNVRGNSVDYASCSNCVITCGDGASTDNGGAGFLKLYDCEVCGNASKHGGGASWCRIWGGRIHHNTASASGGGGLCNYAYGVKVYANTAARGAGFSSNGNAVMVDCEFYDNVATGSGDDGGAITHLNSGADKVAGFVASNCVFRGNTALAGSGGAARYATLVNCVVSNNVALNGGALHNAVVWYSNICSNRALSSGGAGYRSQVHSSTNCGNYAQYGGAFREGTLWDCVVSNNTAGVSGGGAYNTVITNSALVGNLALENGGGAFGGEIVDSHILRNLVLPAASAKSAYGGGVREATVIRSTIAGNAAVGNGEDGYGGASYDGILSACEVHDNFAKVGSALHGGTAADCVVSNNASSSGNYTIRCTKALTRCRVHAQQLEAPGAVRDCVFSGGGQSVTLAEDANVYTSGVFSTSSTYIVNSQGTTIAATNCLFCGNVVENFAAGAQNFYNRTLDFVNCTFADNVWKTTVCTVPGKAAWNSSASFVNCLFAGNVNRYGGAAADFLPETTVDSSQIALVNCLFQAPPPDGWTCNRYENCVTNNPRFDASSAWPYALKYASPARKKGLVDLDWMATATDVRGTGYPRLRDGAVDIGCYQCWLDYAGLAITVR